MNHDSIDAHFEPLDPEPYEVLDEQIRAAVTRFQADTMLALHTATAAGVSPPRVMLLTQLLPTAGLRRLYAALGEESPRPRAALDGLTTPFPVGAPGPGGQKAQDQMMEAMRTVAGPLLDAAAQQASAAKRQSAAGEVAALLSARSEALDQGLDQVCARLDEKIGALLAPDTVLVPVVPSPGAKDASNSATDEWEDA